jgi:hypothetical protein
LQIVAESLLRAVQRISLGENLFNGRHETFVSLILQKLFCQWS